MTAQAFSPAEERGTLVGGSLSTAAIASLAACEENRPWRVGQRVLGCGACTLSCVGGMYGWSTGRILGFTRDGDGGPTLWLCSDDHRADVAQRGRKGQIGRMESVGMWSTVWYTGAPVPVPRRRCRCPGAGAGPGTSRSGTRVGGSFHTFFTGSPLVLMVAL